jgi:hypothetical protein
MSSIYHNCTVLHYQCANSINIDVRTPYVYSLYISWKIDCKGILRLFHLFSDPIYFMIEMCINTVVLVFPRIGKENRTLTVISIPEFGVFFFQKLEIMGGGGAEKGDLFLES